MSFLSSVYEGLRAKDKDAKMQEVIWRKPSYSTWVKNEEKAKRFRKKMANKKPSEALYV